jgi:hypothetical protein
MHERPQLRPCACCSKKPHAKISSHVAAAFLRAYNTVHGDTATGTRVAPCKKCQDEFLYQTFLVDTAAFVLIVMYLARTADCGTQDAGAYAFGILLRHTGFRYVLAALYSVLRVVIKLVNHEKVVW